MEIATATYITSSCIIGNNKVVKNDTLLFENNNTDIKEFLSSAYHYFGYQYPKFYKMDNLCKLGWLAAEVLLQDSLIKGLLNAERISVILANANASLDNDIKYFDSVKDVASPGLFVYTLPNIVIGEICIRHKFKGENAFFIQQDFDTDFLKSEVQYLFDDDLTDACICGWVDVLDQEYKVAFYLIEKQNSGTALDFTARQLDNIFENSI